VKKEELVIFEGKRKEKFWELVDKLEKIVKKYTIDISLASLILIMKSQVMKIGVTKEEFLNSLEAHWDAEIKRRYK
tara:strand:+ start:2249 stop:2476 length:228 start_codon:yes stop_codon:yes gene_type:complete